MVGLVILGTVLSFVLVARARYVHQAAVARRRAVAVRAADTLLLRWWAQSTPAAHEQEGTVEGEQGLVWRTRLVPSQATERLGARVLRLEVIDERARPGDAVLATIDVLVPQPAPTTRMSAEGAGDGP